MIYEGVEIDTDNLPQHIAIIMDGNGRWAKKRTLKRLIGHRKGVETLIDVLNACKEIGIKILSVYAFSIENWKRPEEEVSGLMKLFIEFFNKKFQNIKKEGVRITHSGTKEGLPKNVVDTLDKMIEETKDFKNTTLNLVLNYGGQSEIIDAIKKIVKDISDNKLDIDNINTNNFKNYLYQPELAYPDLVIRTSGELRISNYLLWEIAYSELWFTNTLWPDFTKREFAKAVHDYQQRERRFGEIS